MATFKVIHFFRDQSEGLGWSEVWYIDAANFDAAESGAQNWANQRVKILSRDCLIEYQRIVGNQPANTAPRVRQQRSSTLQKLDLQGVAPGAAGANADLPWTAVKVRWAAGDVSIFKTQLLRGVPDAWFDNGTDKLGAASIKQWIVAAQGVLLGQGLRIRHTLPIVPPAIGRVYTFEAVIRGTYEGYTRRATGRPFGLPRGRRPNRPS
jgi:hypothetical protein